MMSKWCSIALLFLLSATYAQTADPIIDTAQVELDSMHIDTTAILLPDNVILNPRAIVPFLRQLERLDGGLPGPYAPKVNIVHIGDSHIQADLMTDRTRTLLQEQFGNAGRGFVFPHNLARTNGSSDIRFSSNVGWQSHRVIKPSDGSPVGLSGFSLQTGSDDFTLFLDAKTPDNAFTTLKIVTPGNRNSFDLATAKRTVTLESEVPKVVTHRIRNGEVLGSIADKYNVSVTQLKKANGLKSNLIRAGKTLKIPTSGTQKQRVKRSEFIAFQTEAAADYHFFTSDNALEEIYLLPNTTRTDFALSGLILENRNAGVLYHNIGVNGARYSDFNRYPLFFEQTRALSPDLAILAFGTNESFDRMTPAAFMEQLAFFVARLRERNPSISILVVTPPPSLFKRKYPNTFAAGYARIIQEQATSLNYSVWDLYGQLGGTYAVNRNFRRGLMAADRVHYSKAGYELQGELLAKALIGVYRDYLKNRN